MPFPRKQFDLKWARDEADKITGRKQRPQEIPLPQKGFLFGFSGEEVAREKEGDLFMLGCIYYGK